MNKGTKKHDSGTDNADGDADEDVSNVKEEVLQEGATEHT